MSNEWITQRLKSLRLTKGALARALGIDPARISEVVGGRRNVQVAELPIMAQMLQMTTEELVTKLSNHKSGRTIEAPGIAAPPAPISTPTPSPVPLTAIELPAMAQMPRNLPVFGSARGGVDGVFEMNGQAMDYVERPPSLSSSRNAYGVYVQGESMVPRFEPGWLLHVNPNRPVRKGDNVVVQIRGSDEHAPPLAYIKVFDRQTPNKLVVRQFNPPGEMEWLQDDVVSVHRVVGIADM